MKKDMTTQGDETMNVETALKPIELPTDRSSEKYVLCRRDLAALTGAEKPNYCSKTITKANPLNWCSQCRSRLPLWP